MSNFRIIYTRPEDGGVSLVIPAPGIDEAEALKSVPAGVDYHIMPMEEVPDDRVFRNAWIKDGKKIGHDLNKAKEIAHEKRRNARAAEFAPLDVEATIPSKAAQAESKRQTIRDKYDAMQNAINTSASIEVLKNTISSIL